MKPSSRRQTLASVGRRAALEALERRNLLTFAPQLLEDINQVDESTPRGFAELGGLTYFVADDGISGAELWKTDGTPGGTELVKDIWPGASGSLTTFFQPLTRMGNALYFPANDGTTGVELWKTDGSELGTVRVKDISPGAAQSVPRDFEVVGSTLFFSAADALGFELWKSDGSEAGTELVKDVLPGATSSFAGFLTNVGGTLYFAASDGTNGEELWKSDGSAVGTVMVKDINPFASSSFPTALINFNGTLIFQAGNGSDGEELWKSDGSSGGTVMIKDIYSGFNGSGADNFTIVGSTLFFTASESLNGNELWKTDGFEAGTVRVKEIRAGFDGSYPKMLTNYNGTLMFYANDGSTGDELWTSDGLELGTALVKDIRPGSANSTATIVGRWMVEFNGQLFFGANDGTSGPELWTSDGTTGGTVLFKDIDAGALGSYPGFLTNVAGALYFSANDAIHGFEPWKSDGTPGGTQLLKDVSSTTTRLGSGALGFTQVGFNAFFFATDLVHGGELWATRLGAGPTSPGAVLVKDIWPGSAHSYVSGGMVSFKNQLFFVANDGVNGAELWRSDGRGAGTTLVKDIFLGGSSNPSKLTVVGNTLYFIADDGINGPELWKSDGTAAGTVLVRDILPGSSGTAPTDLVNFNGTLYFAANDGTNGRELWKSDGTAGGTVMVKNIAPFSVDSSPTSLINLSGTLYFAASSELWKSDGTDAGTVMVRPFASGGAGSPTSLTNVNGRLYFLGSGSGTGSEPWTSDGTEGGTILLKDIRLGSTSSAAFGLSAVGNQLMFIANDGTTGMELWKSDGTPGGTARVKDIRTGSQSSIPLPIVGIPPAIAAVGDLIYFAANNGTTGTELWQSDGTDAGTTLVQDIMPGATGSSPARLANVLGSLYLQANDGVKGLEPWVVPSGLFADPPPSPVAHHIFYNQSVWDGNSAAINPVNDNAARATDKSPYRPGTGTATSGNVTSFSRGITGIMVDLYAGLGDITASDFVFKVGNNNTPGSWAAAPAPSAISTVPGGGVGGSDRVIITWPTGSITNKWLEVHVLPTTATNITQKDVVFWGNKVGDSGTATPASTFTTSSTDSLQVFANLGGGKPITDLRDYNRDGAVNSTDSLQVFANLGSIVRLNVGVGGPFAPEAEPATATAPRVSPWIEDALPFADFEFSKATTPPATALRRRHAEITDNRTAVAFALAAMDSARDGTDSVADEWWHIARKR